MTDPLHIGLILPEVLGTYGDDGNALVLRGRARMRGIPAEIIPVHLGDAVPRDLDIYCLGGGEDSAQILAAEMLAADGGLAAAADRGAPIFAICAGLQVLGVSFRAAGKEVAGLGLIDATTASLKTRTIGELASQPLLSDLKEPLTGFENHMGATILGSDAQPLGRVVRGIGNCDSFGANGDDAQIAVDGACQGSIICTYMHGPALARNPELADLLLTRAMGKEPGSLPPLDLPEVTRLRQERLAR